MCHLSPDLVLAASLETHPQEGLEGGYRLLADTLSLIAHWFLVIVSIDLLLLLCLIFLVGFA